MTQRSLARSVASLALLALTTLSCAPADDSEPVGTVEEAVTVQMYSQQAYVKASNSDATDVFTVIAVSADGNTLAVGAPGEDSSATGVDGDFTNNSASSAGAVYVFVRSAGVWTQQAYLKASNTQAGDGFGTSVALSADGNTLAVGATGEDSNAEIGGNQSNNSNLSAGAVYVFTRSGTTWTQEIYVKPWLIVRANDNFGHSVALSSDGNTLAVGAIGEDSGTTGIDPTYDSAALDSGAVHIFTRTVGFWQQQAFIKASNTGSGDRFGFAVALAGDGNTLMVGAPYEDSSSTGVNSTPNNSATEAGAGYVFVRSGGTWSQQAYMKASNTGTDDSFGFSVSLSSTGNKVAIGAVGESSNATGVNGNATNNSAPLAGAAYVLTRSGTVWSQQAYVKASNTEADDVFGASIALSGDGNSLAVGAERESGSAAGVNGFDGNNAALSSGAVYKYAFSGGNWAQTNYVKASNPETGDKFGGFVSVALSSNGATLAVGAKNESSNANGINGNQEDNAALESGAVYVFQSSGVATYAQQAYVKASNTNANDVFGSLTLSGDGNTLVVGAQGEASSATGINGNETSNAAAGAGAAYVYTRSAGAWTKQAYVKASNTGASDNFGGAVALSSDGNTLAIGATGEDSSAVGIGGGNNNNSDSAGAVYVYVRSAGIWTQQAYVKASNTDAGDAFGSALALSSDGNTLAVSATGEASAAAGIGGTQGDDSLAGSGAVYVFTRSGTTWAQQAYVKASNPGASDLFGYTVALSSNGSTLAVGSLLEDGSAILINGTANDAAIDAGAAYVFTRSGTSWTQQAYVKASNTQTGDRFSVVSLSADGNTLSVGAPFEDGNALDVGGNQTSNLASSSGAAYVYTRSAGAWSHQAYVKASNTQTADNFGASVRLSGDGNTLAVGAPNEASNATGVNGNRSDNSLANSGAVYTFGRSAGVWSRRDYVKASNTGTSDRFGQAGGLALSTNGNTLVVSTYEEDSSATGVNGIQSSEAAQNSGAAYVFIR